MSNADTITDTLRHAYSELNAVLHRRLREMSGHEVASRLVPVDNGL